MATKQVNEAIKLQVNHLNQSMEKVESLKYSNNNHAFYNVMGIMVYTGLIIIPFLAGLPVYIGVFAVPRLIYFILRMNQVQSISQYNAQVNGLKSEGAKLKNRINSAAKGELNLNNGEIGRTMNIPNEISNYEKKVNSFKSEKPDNAKTGLTLFRFISVLSMVVYIWFLARRCY